jgi:hypothetical protein
VGAYRAARDAGAGRLIGSLWHFTRTEPLLRESALAGAMLFAAFSAFQIGLIMAVGITFVLFVIGSTGKGCRSP